MVGTRRRMGILISGVLTVLANGCAGIVFTEEDNGRTQDVFVGTTFSVSLPFSSGERQPEMKGTILRFLGSRRDESSKDDVFEFEAAGLGEDQIRIPSTSGKAYVLTVRIKSASNEPTVLIHHP